MMWGPQGWGSEEFVLLHLSHSSSRKQTAGRCYAHFTDEDDKDEELRAGPQLLQAPFPIIALPSSSSGQSSTWILFAGHPGGWQRSGWDTAGPGHPAESPVALAASEGLPSRDQNPAPPPPPPPPGWVGGGFWGLWDIMRWDIMYGECERMHVHTCMHARTHTRV